MSAPQRLADGSDAPAPFILTLQVEREENTGLWLAEVVESPGAMAYGPTREEAAAAATSIAVQRLAYEQLLIVTLTPGDERGFVAECPSFAGCISQGETREEALANIREAIALCEDAEDESAADEAIAEMEENGEKPVPSDEVKTRLSLDLSVDTGPNFGLRLGYGLICGAAVLGAGWCGFAGLSHALRGMWSYVAINGSGLVLNAAVIAGCIGEIRRLGGHQ